MRDIVFFLKCPLYGDFVNFSVKVSCNSFNLSSDGKQDHDAVFGIIGDCHCSSAIHSNLFQVSVEVANVCGSCLWCHEVRIVAMHISSMRLTLLWHCICVKTFCGREEMEIWLTSNLMQSYRSMLHHTIAT